MPAVWHTSNTDPVIWKSETTIQTIDSIPGCTVRMDYRISRNFTMDLRFYFNCPTPPTSDSFTVDVPSGMPAVEGGPISTVGVYGSVVGSGGPEIQTYTCRLTGTELVIFQEAANLSTTYESSLFATVVS